MATVKKFTLLLALLSLTACSTVYYETMEQFGVHKRDILVDRVEEARDSQEAAKEQFSSALEQFTTLLNFDGGDLQAAYDSLNGEFEESESRAEAVSDRIRAVENVSADLFNEWEDELVASMHAAESKMTPVVNAFRDQVLFLKHNLNSRAIASLRSELATIEGDISALIVDMENSISESNKFLTELALI